MQPTINVLQEKKLLGMHRKMSFANNTTLQLWQSFMPRRKEIINVKGSDLYSLEVYDNPLFFRQFNPAKEFEKWAAVEVLNHDTIPEGMYAFILPEGQYAVFVHKGLPSEGEKTYRYIFETWLPASEYELDNRPHFALMGDKYKHNSADSEEEIWIPVKHK